MDWLRSTSRSFLMPSGVSSNAQAKNSATGRPSASTVSSIFMNHSGAPKESAASSATCAISQAPTT
ncbi:hypothetical protein D3C83_137900 [compost metagenome]